MWIPKRLNNLATMGTPSNRAVLEDSDEDEGDSGGSSSASQLETKDFEPLTYRLILSNKECFICLLTSCMCVVFALYIDCVLALQLSNHYGVNHQWIGGFFLLSSVTYVIGAPLSYWMAKYLNRRTIVFISFVLLMVQSICLGPS